MKWIVKGGIFDFLCWISVFWDSFHCRCVLVINWYSLNGITMRLIDRYGFRQFGQRLTVNVNKLWLLNYINLAANQRSLIELIREALSGALCEDITLMVQHKCKLMVYTEVAGYDALGKFLSELLVDFLLRHPPLHLWVLANHGELNHYSFLCL